MNPNQDNTTTTKRPRAKLLIISICALLFVPIIGYIAYAQLYPAKITLEFAPKSSVATLNGHKVKAGTIRVKAGEMRVEVKKDGFAGQTKSVTAQKGQTSYVGIALSSNDGSTANWYNEHSDDNVLLQKIYGQNYTNAADAAAKTTPIITLLPYIGAGYEYRIDYGTSPDDPKSNATVLFITVYQPEGKQDALDWIKQQGYDPSKFKIVYYDQANGPQD